MNNKYNVLDDKYIVPYNSENTILMYLLTFIPEISICKLILKHKKILENIDNMDYYMERWENIAGEHYYIHDNHINQFSYIFDELNYVIKKDMSPKFFNRTGISYQIVELVHELIKLKNEYNLYDNLNTSNTYITMLKHDDQLYSFLAKKIMEAMNPPKTTPIYYTKPI